MLFWINNVNTPSYVPSLSGSRVLKLKCANMQKHVSRRILWVCLSPVQQTLCNLPIGFHKMRTCSLETVITSIINHIFKATLLCVIMCELYISRWIHTWKMIIAFQMGKKLVMFLSAQKPTLHASSVMLLFSFSLIFLQ